MKKKQKLNVKHEIQSNKKAEEIYKKKSIHRTIIEERNCKHRKKINDKHWRDSKIV